VERSAGGPAVAVPLATKMIRKRRSRTGSTRSAALTRSVPALRATRATRATSSKMIPGDGDQIVMVCRKATPTFFPLRRGASVIDGSATMVKSGCVRQGEIMRSGAAPDAAVTSVGVAPTKTYRRSFRSLPGWPGCRWRTGRRKDRRLWRTWRPCRCTQCR